MSDYPMLISNKLHSFRNFNMQRYEKHPARAYSHEEIMFSFPRSLLTEVNDLKVGIAF